MNCHQDIVEISKILSETESLTKSFNDTQIKRLAEIVNVEIYDNGKLVVTQDEPNRDLLIVGEGCVTVEIKGALQSNTDLDIYKIRKNGVFGEFSFIDGSRRSASIKAVFRSKVLRLPFQKLDSLCKKDAGVGYKLIRNIAVLLSDRIRNINFELRACL